MADGRHGHSLHGPLMMAVAVLTIPVSDAIAKWLAATLSVGQIALLRFLFQTLFLSPFFLVLRRGYAFRGVFLVLGGLLAAALLFLFWGLKHLPMANNIALFFVEPLILVVFSRIFLGETISARRWVGVWAGLLGALIILRPSWELYGLSAVFPLAAAACYAAYLTVTRARVRTRDHREALVLQFWVGAVGTLAMLAFVLSGQALEAPLTMLTHPQPREWGLLIGAGALGAFAHVLIVMAFARADASVLAPLQYLEIFGATLLGWWVFGEWPDVFTVVGGGLIVGAGVYVVREKRIARQPVTD